MEGYLIVISTLRATIPVLKLKHLRACPINTVTLRPSSDAVLHISRIECK